MLHHLLQRADGVPAARTRDENYPTLLFSWWCTGFAAVIILIRVCARKVRAGVIFNEERLMLLSLIPLFARMGFIHVVLLYGTNNVNPTGLTAEEIHLRQIGSKMVLAARIFYAMFIWVSKLTVSEFLKGIAKASWTKRYEKGLYFIRIFLLATFIAVVIATLGACQPFDHYWQVVPTASVQCRLGYAQLITMGACDIITDILLVAYPIPIIVRSRMPLKRKCSLVVLFSLSLCLIGITATRVPEVISKDGRQQYRTVWASCEILASAAVANAVVLGSFVRDRGIKRNRYKRGSTLDSIDRTATRRSTTFKRTDSDEDLFHALGCRVPTELQNPKLPIMRPAPVARASSDYCMSGASPAPSTTNPDQIDPSPRDSANTLFKANPLLPASPTRTTTPNPVSTVSFWDVGGLLETGPSANVSPRAQTPSTEPAYIPPTTPTRPARTPSVSFWDVGGLLGTAPSVSMSTAPSSSGTETRNSSSAGGSGVATLDFASSPRPPAPVRPVVQTRSHSSRSLLDRFAHRGVSPRPTSRAEAGDSAGAAAGAGASRRTFSPLSSRTATKTRAGQSGTSNELDLQDVGGLLG